MAPMVRYGRACYDTVWYGTGRARCHTLRYGTDVRYSSTEPYGTGTVPTYRTCTVSVIDNTFRTERYGTVGSYYYYDQNCRP